MQRLYNILNRWNTASAEEVVYAKRVLMPDDPTDHIKFKVTPHPELKNDRVYISWFDIDIYQDGMDIGYITVDTHDGNVRYYFN